MPHPKLPLEIQICKIFFGSLKSDISFLSSQNGSPEVLRMSDLQASNNEAKDCVCHSRSDSGSSTNASAMKRLAIACVLVGVFITCEVIGGYVSGSLAIMGDAAHMFSDLASFLVITSYFNVRQSC